MVTLPKILFGKVMHKRLFPKVNQFVYSIYYLALPLSKLDDLPLPHNRPGLLSFYDSDHGDGDGSNLETWGKNILRQYGLEHMVNEIVLVCMPRVLGYVFNPVSFWLCLDKDKNLCCVLCEVHNTFGEKHTYVCALDDEQAMTRQNILKSEKVFHVSPFLKREGHYEFQFELNERQFTAYINYYSDNTKQLLTSLTGSLEPLNKPNLTKAFWLYPLVTLKAILLIHWQALKIILKQIKYIKKPEQMQQKITPTDNLTNN